MDLHGLQAGDAVLKEVASALQAQFGESDVYRFGGDEFVVVLHGREVWVPDSPPETRINHSVVDVSVRRNQRRNHHLDGWIAHHSSGAVLGASATGTMVEYRTELDGLGYLIGPL